MTYKEKQDWSVFWGLRLRKKYNVKWEGGKERKRNDEEKAEVIGR